MPVIDVIFDKLEVNRTKEKIKLPKGGVNVSSNFGVKGVEKDEIKSLGEVAVADFEYTTKYEPEMGDIKIQGRVIYHDKDLDNVLKEKEDKLAFKEKAFEEVNNAVLRQSMVEALILSKEMKLPSPVKLPTVSLEEAKKKQGVDKAYS